MDSLNLPELCHLYLISSISTPSFCVMPRFFHYLTVMVICIIATLVLSTVFTFIFSWIYNFLGKCQEKGNWRAASPPFSSKYYYYYALPSSHTLIYSKSLLIQTVFHCICIYIILEYIDLQLLRTVKDGHVSRVFSNLPAASLFYFQQTSHHHNLTES